MFNRKDKRWRLVADLPVQGGLLIRLIGYWLLTQLAFVGTIAMFDFLSNGQAQSTGSVRFVAPAMIVSFLALVIAMLDMLVFSNRFTGPLVNLRNKMNGLACGEAVEEVRFRQRDFHQDLGNAFNEIRKRTLDESRDDSLTDANIVDDAIVDDEIFNVTVKGEGHCNV